jgi:hypothetical protein
MAFSLGFVAASWRVDAVYLDIEMAGHAGSRLGSLPSRVSCIISGPSGTGGSRRCALRLFSRP